MTTRRWLFWLLIIAFVWVVVSRFTEVQMLVKTLVQGQWQWVLAAALLQVFYYIAYTGLYKAAFDIVDVRSRLRELLPVTFAAIFVNVAAPTGGASGAALWVDDAVRRGQSGARAAVGTLLTLAADFGTFALVLIAGLLILFQNHDLQLYEIVAALILLLVVCLMAAVLLLGIWLPNRLRRLLHWLQRTINGLARRLGRHGFLADDWAETNAIHFIEASIAVTTQPQRLIRLLAVALASHLIDLATLYVLFLAFHQPVGMGVLVAGYAMAILFWIVSPTPQGIGVVEGVVALVFTSLGIPAARATIIALAFRGLSFWLPLVIGFILLRRVKSFGSRERVQAEVGSVHIVALLTGLMGVVNVLSALTPTLADRLALLRNYLPLVIRQGGRLTTVLAGFALLILARYLWRRKHVAWLLTLLVLLVSIASHLLKGLDYEEAILATALAIWLWALRAHFHARSDPPSIRQGLTLVAAAFLFTLAYGTLGFYLLDHHYSVNFSLPAAIGQTIVMFTAFFDPGLQPITGFGRYFADSIYAVGATTLGYALLMLLRPVFVRRPTTTAEHARARTIVEAYGRSPLACFALFDDKAYYFSPGGSLIQYTVTRHTAVALGDPIGPPTDVPAAIEGFSHFCARNDWQATFYQTLPDYLDHYRDAGFEILCIGHEGIVDLTTFTLSGSRNKSLRSVVNRLTRSGHWAELHCPPLASSLLEELRSVSDEWLTAMHGSEKRFSLGWFEDEYIRRSPVMAVYRQDESIVAFANIVSEYQRNEAAVDLMRHRAGIENGTMDFLFISLFQWAKIEGYETFDLGLSALSGVGEQADDPAVERALHYIYEHVDQFYNFKGLHQFKEKFHPTWSPRYLVYPSTATLVGMAVTLNRATTSDPFLSGALQGLSAQARALLKRQES